MNFRVGDRIVCDRFSGQGCIVRVRKLRHEVQARWGKHLLVWHPIEDVHLADCVPVARLDNSSNWRDRQEQEKYSLDDVPVLEPTE